MFNLISKTNLFLNYSLRIFKVYTVQLSRFFVCVVLLKRQLVYINIAVFVCQELLLKSFMSFHKTNGEGGI